MKTVIAILKRIDTILTGILKWITVALFVALTLIVTANVLLRIFPFTSLHWTDEIVEMCFAGLVFYGAAGVWMAQGHFSVGNWIGKLVKNERAKNGYRLLVELITLGFAIILFRYSLDLTLRAREASSVFQIPKRIFYSCMPISSLIMVAYSLVFAVRCAIGTVNPEVLATLEPKE
jgi:TRAP-type C4-dicarboxylate transport system permease small subunit